MSSRAFMLFPLYRLLSTPYAKLRSSLNFGCRDAIHPGMLIFLFPILAVLLLSQAAQGEDARNMRSRNRQAGVTSNDVIPGIVVVKLRRSIAITDGPVVHGTDHLLSAFADRGVTSLARAFPMAITLNDAEVAAGKVDLSNIYYGTIPANMNPVEVAARLAELPQVEYAEPKYYYYTCDVPNDPDYSTMQQVYFDRMNVPAGWTLQKGSPGVVIATVDGGTNWQHEDLAANLWINSKEDINHNGRFDPTSSSQGGDLNGVDDDGNKFVDDVIGWNFTDNTGNPRGSPLLPRNANHGTETASAFGAVTNNSRGMAGTSWNCRIMAVCASDETLDDRIHYGFDGIYYAALMGARVINCSWKIEGETGKFSQADQDVVTWATQAGALVVAAAGNFRQNNDVIPFYPACYDHVLSVGATMDTSDAIYPPTHYGLNVTVFAPGSNIRVALDDGTYGTDGGTSHSSPLVAGLAGLLFSAHPGWRPEQIAEQIRMTADPIDDSNPTLAGSLGHGRVNFYRALSEVHAGIVFIGGRFHKRADTSTVFMTGDTVLLSVKLKNVLTASAENLSFNVSSDPALIPLIPIHGPTRLDAGAEDSLDVAFRVGDLARGQEVYVRLGWRASANEWDARTYKTTVYARTGVWKRQTSPTKYWLTSVHAVSSNVAWATGHNLGSFSPFSPVVLRTTDGGEKWAVVNGDLPDIAAACIFATDSLHAWVGGGGRGGIIFATVNGGLSWTEQLYPPPKSLYAMRGLWFVDASHGYALGDTSASGKIVVLRTTDAGTTWAHLANEPSGGGNLFSAANLICGTDRQHIWFGGTNSLVYRTTNGGETWLSAKAGTEPVIALAMRDDSVGIVCLGYSWTFVPQFARTTDGGATWQAISGIMPNGGWGAAFPVGSTRAWVAGGSTVACSRDNGASWVLERTEPFSGNVIALSFSDPANGWMTTDLGNILRYHDLSTTTAVRHEGERTLPVQALLEQNYPNPFNPSTKIQFSIVDPRLPHEAQHGGQGQLTIVKVFDVLGREVSTLVNEVMQPGTYSVQFDARLPGGQGSGVASGVYFYRLQAGDFVSVRKMVVLR